MGAGAILPQRSDGQEASDLATPRLGGAYRGSDTSASPAWNGSPRARRAGAAMCGQALPKDACGKFMAARLVGGGTVLHPRHARHAREMELELLGLNDIKISSEAAPQRARSKSGGAR